MAEIVAALMTGFNPGQSPPHVIIPIVVCLAICSTMSEVCFRKRTARIANLRTLLAVFQKLLTVPTKIVAFLSFFITLITSTEAVVNKAFSQYKKLLFPLSVSIGKNQAINTAVTGTYGVAGLKQAMDFKE